MKAKIIPAKLEHIDLRLDSAEALVLLMMTEFIGGSRDRIRGTLTNDTHGLYGALHNALKSGLGLNNTEMLDLIHRAKSLAGITGSIYFGDANISQVAGLIQEVVDKKNNS